MTLANRWSKQNVQCSNNRNTCRVVRVVCAQVWLLCIRIHAHWTGSVEIREARWQRASEFKDTRIKTTRIHTQLVVSSANATGAFREKKNICLDYVPTFGLTVFTLFLAVHSLCMLLTRTNRNGVHVNHVRWVFVSWHILCRNHADRRYDSTTNAADTASKNTFSATSKVCDICGSSTSWKYSLYTVVMFCAIGLITFKINCSTLSSVRCHTTISSCLSPCRRCSRTNSPSMGLKRSRFVRPCSTRSNRKRITYSECACSLWLSDGVWRKRRKYCGYFS